jgi:hypothetical protein
VYVLPGRIDWNVFIDEHASWILAVLKVFDFIRLKQCVAEFRCDFLQLFADLIDAWSN